MDNNRDAAWHDDIRVKISYRNIDAEHVVKQSDAPKKKYKPVNIKQGSNFSLKDYIGNGKGKPIELQNLSALPEDIDVYGLEKFLRAVQVMESLYSARVHKVTVEPLSGDTAFIQIGEKTRNCAVVFVDKSVIIEFARPDHYTISTLILNKYQHETITDDIVKLINSAIENNGHWDVAYLDGFHSFTYQFARHSRVDSPEKWGLRLLYKTC